MYGYPQVSDGLRRTPARFNHIYVDHAVYLMTTRCGS